MAVLKPSTTLNATVRSAIVDPKSGMASWQFLKVLQDWDQRITNSLNALGQLIGTVAPEVIIASTDQISDGTGHPLAGGKEAYIALVTSSPALGDVLEWNGSQWVPTALPVPPAPPVTKLIAGTNITLTPPTGLGNVIIDAAGSAGSILTATASIAVAPGGGSTSQFVPIAGGVTNAAAFVQQLQAPGIPFTGSSTGFIVSLDSFSMSFVAGGVQFTVTTTPPAGCSFTAGSYAVNIKAIL